MPRSINLHATSQQGRRPSNEDVELFQMNLTTDGYPQSNKYNPIDFFVICDGHGGSEVAQFVAPKLKKHFMRQKMDFPLMQKDICRLYNHIQKGVINNPDNIGDTCGCTALVLVRYYDRSRTISNEYIQVINLGDCRAVLSRDGLAIPLCKDHKPFWPDEKTRIADVNKRNGTNHQVEFHEGDWRIHDLSVSRAFGDLDSTPEVTHFPDSFVHSLSSADEFIIMACDGLWDIMDNHEAVNFVRDHLHGNNIECYNVNDRYGTYPTKEVASSDCIARKLASYAIAKGSGDNVSIFIIILK